LSKMGGGGVENAKKRGSIQGKERATGFPPSTEDVENELRAAALRQDDRDVETKNPAVTSV